MKALLIAGLCLVLFLSFASSALQAATALTPQVVADRVLQALVGSGTSASGAALAKYTFPRPGNYANYPKVLFTWRKMADESYSSGSLKVYRRFIQTETQSKAGTKLSDQKVMVLYIDGRVGHWRVFTFTRREDWDYVLGLIKGTETHYETPNDFTRGEWFLWVGRPAEALPFFMRALKDTSLIARDQAILRTYLVAVYGKDTR